LFFARTGNVVAWLIFILSAVRLVLAIAIAATTDGPAENSAFAMEYLAASTTGEAIDEAIYGLLAGLVLGILSQIGLSLRSVGKPSEK